MNNVEGEKYTKENLAEETILKFQILLSFYLFLHFVTFTWNFVTAQVEN